MKNKRLYIIICLVPVLLAIPLIAMQFTHEVNWTALDFVVMGGLLLITGLLLELSLRNPKTSRSRWLLSGFVIIAFLLTWVELAVGIL